MRIAETELIINSDGSVFHLHLRPEEIADNIILVGDPARVEMVASFFESREFTRQSREFVTVTGQYKGKRISVLSTGIGTDNIDIAVTELDALANVDFKTREVKKEHKSLNILRVGTSGAIQPDVPIGSYVFSKISLGFDGVISWYADREKVVDLKMEEAFLSHMNWNKHLPTPYFVHNSEKMMKLFEDKVIMGLTISAPGFYGPQGRVLRIPLSMPDMLERLESFRYEGNKITNFEMEGSVIAGLSAHLGHAAGTICCIIANRYLNNANVNYKALMEEMIEVVLDRFSNL